MPWRSQKQRTFKVALYVAYGERTEPVFEAITGRLPEYEPVVVPGFELGVQRAAWMSEQVQAILGEGRTPQEMERFAALVARPKHGARMQGWLTPVSDQELALLDNYDIEGLWLTRYNDQEVRTATGATKASVHALTVGRMVTARSTFGDNFMPTFINDEARTIEIATFAREQFLAEHA
jgi:hypothetical protein